MTDGLQRIGIVASELMERLEEEFADVPSFEIGIVAVVAEISYQDEDGDEVGGVDFRCSDGRIWIQSGLFAAAERAVLEQAADPADPSEEA